MNWLRTAVILGVIASLWAVSPAKASEEALKAKLKKMAVAYVKALKKRDLVKLICLTDKCPQKGQLVKKKRYPFELGKYTSAVGKVTMFRRNQAKVKVTLAFTPIYRGILERELARFKDPKKRAAEKKWREPYIRSYAQQAASSASIYLEKVQGRWIVGGYGWMVRKSLYPIIPRKIPKMPKQKPAKWGKTGY